ncbi:virulence factor [Advenella sp. WQ 585]|uniref:Virulence factor n=1 Tax=Advenella mandrilli TaxID=2800330 RepID=A0ABS1E9T5_9BURK|nr:virulence factor [Advenella mandrilli]MBK1779643.1 virulence factor [Advenella mandrilli]
MKKLLLPFFTAAALSMGSAANAQINVDIGIGLPGVVVERPHRHYAPPPVVYVERHRHVHPRAIYYDDHPRYGHKHYKKHNKKHFKKHGHPHHRHYRGRD